MDTNHEQRKSSPIMKVMGNLHYFQKFAVISLLFAFATLFSLYFMMSNQITLIENHTLALEGNLYNTAIESLAEKIILHQDVAAQYKNGKSDLKNEILSLQNQINTDFRDLNHIDENLSEALRATPANLPNLKPQEIERQWSILAKESFELPLNESNREHITLIEHLLNLQDHISDKSGLVHSAQNEAHYLIQANTTLLPRAQLLLPRIYVTSDLNELISLASQFNENLDNTQTAIEKSYHANQELEGRLENLLGEYLNTGSDLLNDIANNPEDPAKLYALNTKAIKDNFSLWLATSEQIKTILEDDIASLKVQLYWRSALALALCLTASLFGFYVLRETMQPIYTLMEATKKLAEGDLSTRVPVIYNDTVGQLSQSINKVAESFQQIIGQLQWTGIQLTTSTTEIAAAAKQQEATVIQQEATTKEIAVTAKEISATAKDFARTMSDVSHRAEETSANAASGKEALDQMHTIMRQLVGASGIIASKLGALNEKAGTITGVVTTITKVADQTNLLSLNAAIEAEKAGEHGRSFAVIAREIRRLADQTANATYDIEKMVNEMVSAVSAGVMGVDKFSADIHNAVEQVNRVSEHLTLIIEQVQQQTSSFESVNQGMQAQSLGAEQINESIIQLSEVAQQTADSIRQFHRAVEQLNNAAQEMQTSVIHLKR